MPPLPTAKRRQRRQSALPKTPPSCRQTRFMSMLKNIAAWRLLILTKIYNPKILTKRLTKDLTTFTVEALYHRRLGPAQGKLGNLLVLRHLARRLGKPASAVGQVTARPPATAVTFAQLAGYHLQPLRLSALHRQHKHLSASFMNAGSWHRPAIYRDPEKEAVALTQ